MKDKNVFNHEHDIVYYAKCPEESCPHDYVGESGRRVLGKWKTIIVETFPLIFLNFFFVAADHQFVFCDDLRIIGRNYHNNKRKPKIAEALLIKNLKPSLNMQEKLVALELFN